MTITEVRIKIAKEDRLVAFCSIVFDHVLVIDDIKIIEGAKGFFVAMPSRRLKEPCPRCGNRNVVRSAYCSQCGAGLKISAKEGMRAKESAHRVEITVRKTKKIYTSSK